MEMKARLGDQIEGQSYKKEWKIPRSFLLSKENLPSQTLEFVIDQPTGFESNWLVEFGMSFSGNLKANLGLLNHNFPTINTYATGELQFSKDNQFAYEPGFLAISNTNNVVKGSKLRFKFGKRPYKIWKKVGFYVWVKLTLDLYFFKPYVKPANELSLAESKLAFSSNQVLKQNMALLSIDAERADLKVLCSDEVELMAHRVILSARNPVLETMMRVDMAEKDTGIISVDDVGSATMKILLHYWYTGELQENWKKPEIIHEFVYAAGKYQLEAVLEFLDNVLGTEQVSPCDLQLLSLVSKLGLGNADGRIAKKLSKLLSQATSGIELLNLCNK